MREWCKRAATGKNGTGLIEVEVSSFKFSVFRRKDLAAKPSEIKFTAETLRSQRAEQLEPVMHPLCALLIRS